MIDTVKTFLRSIGARNTQVSHRLECESLSLKVIWHPYNQAVVFVVDTSCLHMFIV